MDVGFSDDQLALRASVREVLATECPPAVLRQAHDDPERWRPLWKTATDLGWTSLALLEGDVGVVELVAVLEECGYAAAPVPLLSSAGLAAGALRGIEGVQQELADGAVGALLLAGPGARGPVPALRLDGTRLTGTAGAVPEAARADVFAAIAEGPDGAVVAVVRPGPGVTVTPRQATDPTRPLADVTVDVVPEQVRSVVLTDALALPLTAAAADLVGTGTRLLDLAVAHATTRDQFGKPIGAFQGVKHRLADCYVALERARSLLYGATMAVHDVTAPAGDRWRAALLAKAAAGEAATATARAAVQVHGAMAMTAEHDVHLFLRRAWQSAALLGEPRALYATAARQLVGEG